jgi:hypothetical protein
MADVGRRGALARARGGEHGKVGEWLEQASAAPSSRRPESEWDEWVEESASAVEPELDECRRGDRPRRGRAGRVAAARSGAPRCAWSRHEDASAIDPSRRSG